MLRIDRCALICDLAEVYSIYDYRSLPATRVATFAVGLRNDSRIKSIMRGEDLKGNTQSDLLLANISDILMAYLSGGREYPSMLEGLLGKSFSQKKSDDNICVFDSPDEFDIARQKIIGG